MEKNNPLPEAESWQKRYLSEKAHWDDLLRIGIIIVPIAIVISITIIFARIIKTRFEDYLTIGHFNITNFLPLILLLAVFFLLYRVTIHFVKELYQPPKESRLPARIQQRLLGVPPLPTPLDIFWKYHSVFIKEPKDLDKDHWARWFGGPAMLSIVDGIAIYLERGNCFSRVVGPGKPPKPFLDRYETIKAVVDLRPQIKTGTVHPWTKDGIQLDLTVTMESQINASAEARRASRNLVYPFDPVAVKQAVEYTAVKSKPEDKERQIKLKTASPPIIQVTTPPSNIQLKKDLIESDWLEGVWDLTTGFINWHISCHSIDEIALSELIGIGPSEGNLYTFNLAQEHIESINKTLVEQKCGAHISSIQITMDFPLEVKEHRIKYWESVRQSRSSIRMSKAKGDRIRLVEEARARAEHDMLDAITGRLKNIHPDNLTEPILMSLTGILDNSLDDPLIRPIIAKNSLSLLEQLRKTLKDKF